MDEVTSDIETFTGSILAYLKEFGRNINLQLETGFERIRGEIDDVRDGLQAEMSTTTTAAC